MSETVNRNYPVYRLTFPNHRSLCHFVIALPKDCPKVTRFRKFGLPDVTRTTPAGPYMVHWGRTLTLPDGTALAIGEALAVIDDYRQKRPAVIDLYDLSNTGPHDIVEPIDLLSLTAMHAYGSAPMGQITSLWLDRDRVSDRVRLVSKKPIESLNLKERNASIERLENAIRVIKRPDFAEARTSKMLHRLRPNVMPLWDDKIAKWYPGHRDPNVWRPWLEQVYGEVTAADTLVCLKTLQLVEPKLSVLRIWDIILYQIADNPNLRP